VAKAEPTPTPMVKTPEPVTPAPEAAPAETAPAETAESAPSPSPPSQPQVAAARPPSIWRQPGGGGGLQGGGRGGVDGQPIPLDTPEPKYQDYFNKVRERIKSKWVYPRPAGERGIEGELLIEFHIAKDGSLEFIELRLSSGTPILDDAALTAVKLAQPFPPVPDDIAKRTLAINGQFRYQVVSGFVNQFLR
jgi:protein TonB